MSYFHVYTSKISGNKKLITVISLFQGRERIRRMGTVVEGRLFSAMLFIHLVFESYLMFPFKT